MYVFRPRAQAAQNRKPEALWLLSSVPIIAFLAFPVFALLGTAQPGDVLQSLQTAEAQGAMKLSLYTSVLTTLLALILGTPLAYLLARRSFPFRGALDTLVDLPILIPPAVAGIGLLVAFGRQGLIGSHLRPFGIELPFTAVAVVLAQLFVAAPFYVRAASIGFARADSEMEEAAQLDGAGSWQTFRDLHLPLAWAALVSGCVTTWARALGEFGATIIFAGNFPGRTQTMPLAIYLGFELDFRVAASLSIVLLLSSFLLLLAVRSLIASAEPVTLQP
ncbi:MAG: molybdate ABC transporter permease subunit [Armatimonadetes bacterium]|nr:molybdate ABC transporter permease subunit [Armatimonadota bacterium]